MGRLLKAAGRVVPGAVVSAQEEAARILAEATAERELAREEARALRMDAERRGFEVGVAAGREQAAAEVTGLIAAARAEAAAERERASEGAVALGRRMAERILGMTIELSPEAIGGLVAQALEALRARSGTFTLRVHPEDLAAVEWERPRWSSVLAVGADVRVVADPGVGRHGCVVESPVGRLDARLDTQLEALERALARVAPARRPR